MNGDEIFIKRIIIIKYNIIKGANDATGLQESPDRPLRSLCVQKGHVSKLRCSCRDDLTGMSHGRDILGSVLTYDGSPSSSTRRPSTTIQWYIHCRIEIKGQEKMLWQRRHVHRSHMEVIQEDISFV